MSDLTIRPATTADHDAWLPLWRGYRAFYQVDLPEATTRTARPGFVQYRKDLA